VSAFGATTAGNRGSGKSKVSSELGAKFIKNSLSPLDFYQHELPGAKLIKHGWCDAGLCVFHNDTNTGSFKVNTETGQFKCFSCGVSGGDIISFTMALYGLNFGEALIKLADDWGLA